MKSMRDTYLKTYKKVKKSGSGRAKLTDNKRKLMKLCEFLQPFVKPRGGIDNLTTQLSKVRVINF